MARAVKFYVRVTLNNGFVEIVQQSPGVEVVVKDYDHTEDTTNNHRDKNGQYYTHQVYGWTTKDFQVILSCKKGNIEVESVSENIRVVIS